MRTAQRAGCWVVALGRWQSPPRWLVYTHAPLGMRKAVEITVPDHGKITADITQAGSFYLVDERPARQ